MQTIHINLVSDQLVPNLIPVFADKGCQGIVLVLGDNTQNSKAENLKRLYEKRNLPVLWQCEGTSSHRPAELHQQARKLIDWLATHHSDKHWVLNATCGTKPMALIFANTFNRYNSDHPDTVKNGIPQALIVYTDSQNRELPLLNDGVDYALKWQAVVTFEEMLAAHGFEPKTWINEECDDEIQARAELSRYLGKQFKNACRFFLGTLQYAANQALDHPDSCAQFKKSPQKAEVTLCLRLQEEGLLHWDPEQPKQVRFTSQPACRYLSGGWLEELTYLSAKQCGFSTVAMSVEGEWRTESYNKFNNQGKNNEFDVLICHNNQLLTIECKAKHWGEQFDGESTNQDVVHKLENLGNRLGGAYGLKLLVSARQITPAMKQRIKDAHCDLCDNADGKTLVNALQARFDKMN